MKCQDIEKYIVPYADNEISRELQLIVEAHLQACPSCQQRVNRLQAKATAAQVTTSSLPPRSSRRRRKRKNWRRWTVATVATLLIALLIGTSFLTRLGEDLGLKKAAEQWFSTPVHASVTDQGITLKIMDILADPTRAVVTYVLVDDQGDILPDLYFETNQLYVTDEKGEKIAEGARFQRGEQYADLTFSLRNPPNHIVVHMDVKQYGAMEIKPVQWSLKIPVDIEKTMAASKTIPIHQSFTTPEGLNLHAKQVTYAPSATRLEIETQWTGEAKERIQKQARERLQMDPDESFLHDLLSHKISYHMEDEQGQIYADMVPGSVNQTKTVSLAEYTVENDADKQGWYGSFVPYEEKGKLILVLDEIMVNEPADISLTFDPKKLSRQPFRQQIGDNTYTLSPLVQETMEGTGEKVWKMELDIVGTTTSWPKWFLRDDKGRSYPVAIDYQRSPIEGSSAGAHVKETLLIKQLDQLPSQLTLLMQTQKKTYDNFQWRVEIPPAP
ncbi:DUF4179 domain-containing protein [Brevibacillus panacihumi]|uniref:DUF4179 domain-containing protein n=1 Tax=Brevibacillus panacihumi TaxID=497735 RepID=UPI003D01E24A